jgi:hypothetical protein
MTTIKLPQDVATELLFAANSKNQTAGDYLLFLLKGDNHLARRGGEKILPSGDNHLARKRIKKGARA